MPGGASLRTVNGMSIYPPSTLGLATKDVGTQATGGVLVATRRVLVAFAVLTALAANQLLVVASFTDRLFAWTIAVRPTSAFLGAAYAAGFVLAIVALRRHSWREVRVALVTVTVFTVLTLIPTLVHLHIFHLTSGGLGRSWRPGSGWPSISEFRSRVSASWPDSSTPAASSGSTARCRAGSGRCWPARGP